MQAVCCIVGHRGCGSDSSANLGTRARENTLLSFQLAHKLGADYVEFDVQLSADGVPVIYHDWGVLVPVPGCLPVRVPVGKLGSTQLQSFHAPEILNGAGLRNEGVALSYSRQPTSPAAAFDSCNGFSRNVRTCAALGLDLPQATSRTPAHLGWMSMNGFSGPQGSQRSQQARAASRCAYSLQQDYRYGMHDRFTTLEALLLALPTSLGFNIELKYPGPDELRQYGLQGSVPSPGEYIEKVMSVVARCMVGERCARALVFSSFDPDVCLAWKQWYTAAKAHGTLSGMQWSIMFLTEGGTHSGTMSDPRMVSLQAALDFACAQGLQGVVTHAPALWGPRDNAEGGQADGGKQASVQQWVKKASDSGLRLFTYGSCNMDMEVVRIQAQGGVHGIITDHIKEVVQTLRPKCCH